MENLNYAIVASVMFAAGFVHGMLVKVFLNSIHVADVEQKLQDAIDRKFESDLEVDELQDKVKKLETMNKQIQSILDGKVFLPPPPFKLTRHVEPDYSDSDSDVRSPVVTSP